MSPTSPNKKIQENMNPLSPKKMLINLNLSNSNNDLQPEI